MKRKEQTETEPLAAVTQCKIQVESSKRPMQLHSRKKHIKSNPL